MLGEPGIELSHWGMGMTSWSLYAIKGTPYGLAACNESRRTHFSYQLPMRGEKHNLIATSRPSVWDPRKEELTRSFQALCATGTTHPIDVAIVLMTKEGHVNFDKMKECMSNPHDLPNLPNEVHRLAYTIGRLTTWEDTIARYAPTTPSPSPLKMHAIFDCLVFSEMGMTPSLRHYTCWDGWF